MVKRRGCCPLPGRSLVVGDVCLGAATHVKRRGYWRLLVHSLAVCDVWLCAGIKKKKLKKKGGGVLATTPWSNDEVNNYARDQRLGYWPQLCRSLGVRDECFCLSWDCVGGGGGSFSQTTPREVQIRPFPSRPDLCSAIHRVNFRCKPIVVPNPPGRQRGLGFFLFGTFLIVSCDSFPHCYHCKIQTELFLRQWVVVSNRSDNDTEAFIRDSKRHKYGTYWRGEDGSSGHTLSMPWSDNGISYLNRSFTFFSPLFFLREGVGEGYHL